VPRRSVMAMSGSLPAHFRRQVVASGAWHAASIPTRMAACSSELATCAGLAHTTARLATRHRGKPPRQTHAFRRPSGTPAGRRDSSRRRMLRRLLELARLGPHLPNRPHNRDHKRPLRTMAGRRLCPHPRRRRIDRWPREASPDHTRRPAPRVHRGLVDSSLNQRRERTVARRCHPDLRRHGPRRPRRGLAGYLPAPTPPASESSLTALLCRSARDGRYDGSRATTSGRNATTYGFRQARDDGRGVLLSRKRDGQQARAAERTRLRGRQVRGTRTAAVAGRR